MSGDVTLCVLAGGEARRMGCAKAELRVAGKPILSFLLDRIAWGGATMLVTAPGREHPPGAELFGREVVDRVRGEGPLRGIATALENLQTALAVMVTVDMPLVGREPLTWLIENLAADKLGLMLSRASRIEPFPSVFRQSALDVVHEQLRLPRRSVADLALDGRIITVNAPNDWPQEIWTNLNTPADCAQLDRRLARP